MRILFWDIETAQMELTLKTYSLKTYSKYLPSSAITRPIWMPCAAWQWRGEKKVHSVSVLDDPKRFKKNYSDDFHVVKTLHGLMEEADIIIAHNGDNFDWKELNKAIVCHDLPPMPHVRKIDTLKMARGHFRFEGNDLRYLARRLGVAQKDDPPNWDKVSSGDVAAIKECIAYNKKDIAPLVGVFEKLYPHAKVKLHTSGCPYCGSGRIIRRGERAFNVRMTCRDCQKHFTFTQAEFRKWGVQFRIDKDGLSFRVKRNNRATSAARRNAKKKKN